MSQWLVDIADLPIREPLVYLVPHAGAGVGAVLPLGRALADHLTPVAVRLPGRESLLEQEPITDLTVIAGGLAEQIRQHAGSRPSVIYGHSSGAVVAYETARRLPAEQLILLVISAQAAPGGRAATSTEVWDLPDAEFFARVARDGYLPAELLAEPELLSLVGPAVRADYQAVNRHLESLRDPRPVGAPIIAVHAEDDDTVDPDDITGWASLTTREWRMITRPGGHNLLRDDPVGLADVIRDGVLEVAGKSRRTG